MKYNFDAVTDRFHTDCMKWDMLEMKYGSKDMVPMWVADMDFKAPDEVVAALTKRAEHGIFGYGIKCQDYYQSICDWFKRRHGFEFSRANMLYMPGVVPGLNYSIRTYSKEGDGVTVLTPIYEPFYKVIRNTKRTVVECALTLKGSQYEINFEELEKCLVRSSMMLLCSPHNPAGRVWTKEELEKIGELCEKHDVILVSDEIHCDLVFDGYKHLPTASVNETLLNRTIMLVSPSKTFNIAGLQAATVVVPNKELFDRFVGTVIEYGIGMTNVFAIEGSKAAYTYGDEWLDEVIAYIRGNYEYVKTFLAENLPQIKCLELQATYLMWLDLREITTQDEEVVDLIEKQAKIAGETGTIFGTNGAGFYRLNIATQRANVEEAMKRLLGAVKNR